MSAAEDRVDVVDAEDRVIDTATRAEVRARRLRHRATYVLVFNQQGQIFVHKRTATKDIYPCYYDVAVGGVLGAGEGYDDGARRELAEELGVSGVALRRVMPCRFEDEHNCVNGMIYSCTCEGPFRLQPEEIESGEWLDLDAVLERTQHVPFCPDGLDAFFRYLSRLAEARKP